MAEELLDRPDVGAALQQVRREGMPEGVTPGRLRDPGADHRLADEALQGRLVEVVPSALTRFPMRVPPGGGEDPLSAPLPPRVGILATEGVG